MAKKKRKRISIIWIRFFQVVQDWKFVAQVLDRIFLWAFLTVSVLGTILIFTPAVQKFLKIIPPAANEEESPPN